MNLFSVVFSNEAKSDVLSASTYIAKTLGQPQAAIRLLDELRATLSRLSEFPHLAQLSSDAQLRSLGIRAMPVYSYVLFYQISEEKRVISVVRFLHSYQDRAKHLL